VELLRVNPHSTLRNFPVRAPLCSFPDFCSSLRSALPAFRPALLRFRSDRTHQCKVLNGNQAVMILTRLQRWNERVRELTGQNQLLSKIRKHRLQWWGHIQRMEDGRRAKQALSWIPEGSCKIGRPRITWSDNITKDIENSGVTWEEALLLMTDKQDGGVGLFNVQLSCSTKRVRVTSQFYTFVLYVVRTINFLRHIVVPLSVQGQYEVSCPTVMSDKRVTFLARDSTYASPIRPSVHPSVRV